MFFQSIYARFTLGTEIPVQVELFKSLNALADTYVGNAAYDTSNEAFAVGHVEYPTDTKTEINGLPTFNASVTGISDADAYFHMDFLASHTVVWNENCSTTEIGSYPASTCFN